MKQFLWGCLGLVLAGCANVEAVDAYHGMVFTDAGVGFAWGHNAGLYRTTDGGRTWQLLHINDLGSRRYRSWAVAATDDDIWLCAKLFREKRFLHTDDEGRTWSYVQLPGGSFGCNYVQFTDANTGWAVNWKNYSGDSARIWLTQDRGASWQPRHVPPPKAMELVLSVDFLDEIHGCLGTDDGLFCTSDGGFAWRKLLAGDQIDSCESWGQPCWALGVAMIDARTIVSGWGRLGMDQLGFLAITRDNGETWATQRFESPLQKVHFVDRLNGWISGYQTTPRNRDEYQFVLRTRNGGLSWDRVIIDSDAKITDFLFVNELVGLALARDGRLFRTIDGGDAWTMIYDLSSERR